MPLLVVQRGHVPRTRGATGGPYEQATARAVADLIVDMAPEDWKVRVIDADEPTHRYAGDAFVSLHCDASSSSSVRGASVGYRTAEGRALAASWKAAYAAAGWPGTFRRDNYTAALAGYYGTGRAVQAGNRRAVIVEQGFTTNPTERAWITSDAGRMASARAVVRAVTGVDPLVSASSTSGRLIVNQQDEDRIRAIIREEVAAAVWTYRGRAPSGQTDPRADGLDRNDAYAYLRSTKLDLDYIVPRFRRTIREMAAKLGVKSEV